MSLDIFLNLNFFFFFFFFQTCHILDSTATKSKRGLTSGEEYSRGQSLVEAEKKYEVDVCDYAQVYLHVNATLINQAQIPSNELSLGNV